VVETSADIGSEPEFTERTWNVIDNKALLFLEWGQTWNIYENKALISINPECS